MTDKVQKIREEVERMQDLTMDKNKNFYSEASAGEYYALCNIEHFIDSLQEEPVSIWHDASEKSNEPEEVVIINPSDNTGDVLTRCTGIYQGRIWAYTSELLKLSNLERIGKNWKEEPISEDLGEYINELSKQFPEVSFAKLSRIAVRVAKWKEEQNMASLPAKAL